MTHELQWQIAVWTITQFQDPFKIFWTFFFLHITPAFFFFSPTSCMIKELKLLQVQRVFIYYMPLISFILSSLNTNCGNRKKFRALKERCNPYLMLWQFVGCSLRKRRAGLLFFLRTQKQTFIVESHIIFKKYSCWDSTGEYLKLWIIKYLLKTVQQSRAFYS